MKMVKFIGSDFNVLEQLGYTFSIAEGGWISPTKSTVIYETRSPYQRQIHQYSRDMGEAHDCHVAWLIANGYAKKGEIYS